MSTPATPEAPAAVRPGLKLTFEHDGTTRTLVKHPAIARALKAGTITPDQARLKPWYLRLTVAGREKSFKLLPHDKDALRGAKDIIKGQRQDPAQFSAWVKAQTDKRSVTLGALAQDWAAASYAFRKTELRTPAAAAQIKGTIGRALPFWSEIPVATVTPHTLEDYAARRAPCLRSADLELSSLSSLCQWAVLTGKIPNNPFNPRPRFATVKQHCHEACPDNDETLHQMLRWLFDSAELELQYAAGWLTFCALTGLRPGEPACITRLPALAVTPANTRDLPVGAVFPDRLGQHHMKVQRLKHGQNPFVKIHPVLADFLRVWRAWLAVRCPGIANETRLFPTTSADPTTLNRALNRASEALKLPHFKPHGFGRAYYVKVRRSQGADDSTIAGELGQTTNGDLIRAVYGDPQDLHGGGMFDWLPDGAGIFPAWDILKEAVQSNIIAL